MDTPPFQTRPQQIAGRFSKAIDTHLNDLLSGKAETMLEINDLADLLFIHPTHLSNVIKEHCGTSPCGIYQLKLIDIAQRLLSDRTLAVKEVAARLTFEPSQFTKWFKRFHGITPKEFRQGKAFQLHY